MAITLKILKISRRKYPGAQLHMLIKIHVKFHDFRSNTFELRATQKRTDGRTEGRTDKGKSKCPPLKLGRKKTLDCKMSFSKHIISKVNKAYRNLGLKVKRFIYMNKEMLFLYFIISCKASFRGKRRNLVTVILTKISIESVQKRATTVLSELSGNKYSERLVAIRHSNFRIQKK
jgi:hypothetical protein